MFDNVSDLQAPLARSAASLRRYAGEAARSQAGAGGAAQDSSMANLAKAAIFSEALLSAVHARLQELKTVSK